ncbi:uncharacterized protein [Mycetomoellerius zeteki]|uniref:uncharacterized protein n=1 Tax=Mycetomoellerius zeteki TaxID=64791 RepID=UPI00084ECAC3|nr:PREDICTED: uncharacterized protein LOC108730098 [Trachymyrmex zeteki]
MKFSYVIFICSLVIVSAVTMIELTHSTFNSCNPGQWIMTNTKVDWKNKTKMISCNITYKELNNSKIYKIHIMMDCEDINSNCTNEPIVWVDNIDCNSQNLSLPVMDACKIGNELTKWQKQKELFEDRYGSNENIFLKAVFCINIMNDYVDDTEYF